VEEPQALIGAWANVEAMRLRPRAHAGTVIAIGRESEVLEISGQVIEDKASATAHGFACGGIEVRADAVIESTTADRRDWRLILAAP
jgi:hypothetical protein